MCYKEWCRLNTVFFTEEFWEQGNVSRRSPYHAVEQERRVRARVQACAGAIALTPETDGNF